MKIKTIITILVLAIFILAVSLAYAQQDTCPDGGNWTKINSGDLDLYPVAGATEYCFKAGNWVDDTYPEGGFDQEGSCTEAIQYCALSHWSYFIPGTTPTDTPTSTPTATPSATLTPTSALTGTPTPTLTSTPTPTPGITDTPSENNDPAPTPVPSNCTTTKGGLIKCL